MKSCPPIKDGCGWVSCALARLCVCGCVCGCVGGWVWVSVCVCVCVCVSVYVCVCGEPSHSAQKSPAGFYCTACLCSHLPVISAKPIPACSHEPRGT